MKDLRREADEIYEEFANSLFGRFKKERFGIGCHSGRDARSAENRKALLEWQTCIYDEIFDRLARKDQDACNNRLKTGLAFFGWLSDPTILSTAEAIIAASKGNAFYTKGGPVICDYTINRVPEFLWMAELTTEPLKTRYAVIDGMEGSIGNADTDLFGPPVLVGIYRLYISVYPTQQNENSIEFKVF